MTEKLSAFSVGTPTPAKYVAGANAAGNEKYLISALAAAGIVQDTAVNILALTPSAGSIAYATDMGVLFVADGVQWNIDTSYFIPQSLFHDLGAFEFSNRLGYGKNYVSDKDLANCSVGQGSDSGTDGQLRHGPFIFANGTQPVGLLQIYQNNEWETVTTNVDLRDTNADFNFALEDFIRTLWIQIYSGDSEVNGLNGLPLIQGYKAEMGAYPVQQQVNGGTF